MILDLFGGFFFGFFNKQNKIVCLCREVLQAVKNEHMRKVKHLDHPQARASTDPRHVDTALQAPYRHINLLTAVADDVFQRMNAENKSHMTTY